MVNPGFHFPRLSSRTALPFHPGGCAGVPGQVAVCKTNPRGCRSDERGLFSYLE
jgi:hypothetical protein